MSIPMRPRLRRLEPVLRRALRGPCAQPCASRLLVAVSGGADSTALLIGLERIAHEFGIRLEAAHLHHGLRGAEANQDLAFVRELCARLGVPLTAARWNTRLRMKRRGLGGQAGLRALRREFLIAAALKTGSAAIATAHTADDQLETVLMRLARGAGLPGLGGMSERRGMWIKPLLEATRADIERDLTRIGQQWREDSSNRDRTYARNQIRFEVVPALTDSLGPSRSPGEARASMARRVADAAREARDARRALERCTLWRGKGLYRIQKGEFALDSRKLGSYPLIARRLVFRRLWRRAARIQPGLTHRHLEALDRLVTGSRGVRVDLPDGWRAERDLGWIRLRRIGARTEEVARLTVPSRLRWDGWRFSGCWTTGSRALRTLSTKPASEEFFAADALQGELELRVARADETFIPFGHREPVRVEKFMRHQRVALEHRSSPKVLADAGGILWVIGVRRSARAPIDCGTRNALRVRVERHD